MLIIFAYKVGLTNLICEVIKRNKGSTHVGYQLTSLEKKKGVQELIIQENASAVHHCALLVNAAN